MCTIVIFSTVPVARSVQKFVYSTIGKEFFTYIVLFVVIVGLATLLYFFIFKLKVKRISQYIWLFVCAGLYVFFTIKLRKYPEEAIHLLEYGLLSFLLFKALSHRIRDRTIYLSAVLFVLFVGIADEFLQWIIPQRFWDFRDVGFNVLAGSIFMLAVWKGIKPEIICRPVRKISIKMLVGIITIDLIFLGLCLSNTPSAVYRYTAIFKNLSWLQSEEHMTEFGYKYKDPEIGTFYSRFNLEELRKIDFSKGEPYRKILLTNLNSETEYKELIKIYNPNTNPFLYEFIRHLSRRDNNFDEFYETKNSYSKIVAFKENLLLEKYFGNTLKYTDSIWSDKIIYNLGNTALLRKEHYTSKTGKLITSFSLKTAWILIVTVLVVVLTFAILWKKRIEN